MTIEEARFDGLYDEMADELALCLDMWRQDALEFGLEKADIVQIRETATRVEGVILAAKRLVNGVGRLEDLKAALERYERY